MPSAYEPCGLNQMYSQRYGTVPIVHATGGLKDTVADCTPERLADGTASGFAFTTFDARISPRRSCAPGACTREPRPGGALQRASCSSTTPGRAARDQ